MRCSAQVVHRSSTLRIPMCRNAFRGTRTDKMMRTKTARPTLETLNGPSTPIVTTRKEA